jgi:hypothetical protein
MPEGDAGAGDAFAASFGALRTNGTLLATFKLQRVWSVMALCRCIIYHVLEYCIPSSDGR